MAQVGKLGEAGPLAAISALTGHSHRDRHQVADGTGGECPISGGITRST